MHGHLPFSQRWFLVLTLLALAAVPQVGQAESSLAWTAGTPLPSALTDFGTATDLFGNIYVIGGGATPGGPALNTVEQYNPQTNTWQSRAPLPEARSDLAVVAANNGKIYAMGGSPATGVGSYTSDTNHVYAYDPQTNQWTGRAPMPVARSMMGAALATNGKIYVIGGDSPQDEYRSAEVEEYDPVTDAWRKRADMPTPRMLLGVAAGNNGKVYAIGGHDADNAFATVEEYDPAADTWQARAPMPAAAYRIGATTAPSGLIYVAGQDDSSKPIAFAYDPAANTWQALSPLPTARWSLGLAVSGKNLYAMGGTVIVGRGSNATIAVDEVDVAALPDTASSVTDLGFRPQVNGFSFQNRKITGPSEIPWAMFEQFYGKSNLTHPDGSDCAEAKAFYNDYILTANGYSCFGFSATSLLDYLNKQQPYAGAYAMPNIEPLYQQPVQNQSIFYNTINYYQRVQNSASWTAMQYQEYNQCGKDPAWPLSGIKEGIKNQDPVILNLYAGGYGHSIVPYKVEETSATDATVWVYDNEAPGQESQVTFHNDGTGWSWTYTFKGSLATALKTRTRTVCGTPNDMQHLELYPLSLALQPPQGVAQDGTAVYQLPIAVCRNGQVTAGSLALGAAGGGQMIAHLPADGNWLIVNQAGQRLGWQSGTALSEIPNGREKIQLAGPGDLKYREFFVPDAAYTVQGDSAANASYSLTLFGSGSMIQETNTLRTAGAASGLAVQPGLGQATVTHLDNSKTLDLTLDAELQGVSHVATVTLSGISGTNDLQAQFDGQTLTISRTGGTLTYQVKIEQVGNGSDTVFQSAPVTLGANERHILQPSTWTKLDTATLTIKVDRGMDGTIDQTINLSPGAPAGIKIFLPNAVR